MNRNRLRTDIRLAHIINTKLVVSKRVKRLERNAIADFERDRLTLKILSDKTTNNSFKRSLQTTGSAVVVQNNRIVEVMKDRSVRIVCEVAPDIKVEKGSIFMLE